jgi:hypothetical protein
MIKMGTAVPVTWNDPVLLDQGSTPRCVGYAAAAFKATAEVNAPADDTVTNKTGDDIYAACKVIDGDNEDGTNIRSAAKVIKKMGVIDAYAFGSRAQGKDWVAKYGPVILGVRWDYGMEEPDSKGYVHPDGNEAGGHAVLWRGVNVPTNKLRNSWGDWGPLHGDCLITDRDLTDVLSGNGEVMMAVKLVKPTPPPPPPPPPAPDNTLLEEIIAKAEEFLAWLKSLVS